MDDGLIQILVIAFFVIISMMDGVARKKRQQQQGEADPSLERPDADPDSGRLFGAEPETTSEGLVPQELWEEIAALARGEPSPSTRRVPSTSGPEMDRESRSSEREEETWLDPRHQHVESHDHVEWAPDDELPYQTGSAQDLEPGRSLTIATPGVEARAPERAYAERAVFVPEAHSSDEPVATPRAEGKGAGVRRILMGSRESIRQAVILSEVLAPPLALRDEDYEPASGR